MSMIQGLKNRYAAHRLNKINNLENMVNYKQRCLKAASTSPEKLMPDKPQSLDQDREYQ
ncbi:MAG TPA: hypothetical protein VMC48_04355 [Methanobacterium sp.]|nr:hypothetical protein [Methanobacterium sp.]